MDTVSVKVPAGGTAFPLPLLLSCAIAVFAVFLSVSCGKKVAPRPPAISACLVEENRSLFLVLRNDSDSGLVICKRNFYNPVQCLDIRKSGDTSEFPLQLLFEGARAGVIRANITMNDFEAIDSGGELRLPVDLRPVRRDVGAGRPVLISVYFRNVDPFSCSRLEAANFDKATQDYCRLMHYVPNKKLRYWTGEVRTPYLAVSLKNYVRTQRQAAKKRSQPVVVRKSKTHPLPKKVF